MRRLTKDKHVYELDPQATPAITIASGEELIVEMWDVFQGLRDPQAIFDKFERPPETGLISDTLPIPATGPIYVEGAMPGDALKIDFIRLRAIKDAVQRTRPQSGYLADDFPEIRVTVMPIEGDHLLFPGDIKIPLKPDVGMVATMPNHAQHPSGRIGPFGGDIDLHELGDGNTLYLPVFVEGGLLAMGDGHAVAGEATLAGTAAETELEIHLRVTVGKGVNLKSPRALTPEHFVILAHGRNDGDLGESLTQAVREMVDFLVEERGMEAHDAYTLLSFAGNVVGPPSSRRLYMSSPKVTLSRKVYDQLG